MRNSGRTLATLALLGVLSCGDEAENVSHTQSNWLSACDDSAQCGRFSCICGVCSIACDSDDYCQSRSEGSACMDTEALDSCATSTERICIGRCDEDEDCGPGFDCHDGACLDAPAAPIDPPGIECREYASCSTDQPCNTDRGGECVAIAGCRTPICIAPQLACALSCPSPSACPILESFPLQIGCAGALPGEPGPASDAGDPEDPPDAGGPDDCAELAQDACASAEGCQPLRDVSRTFFECSPLQICGEAETCAEGPAAAVLFPTTCLPNGYTPTNDSEPCEGQALCGAHTSETDCDDDAACFAVVGADLGYLGCLQNQACDDAITCGQSPTGQQDLFIDSCLPAGWRICMD